jgi:hypothetical protein
MLSLTIFLLVLAVVFFWAGYRAPPHPLQYRSRAGFFICLALAGFTGYFAWRETRTIGELAALIDPIPEITGITYVPTSTEAATVAQFMAATPGRGRLGTTPEARRDLAERVSERRTEYWLIKTSLRSDSVFAFYRDAAARRGWTIETDSPPWLYLARGAETLVLFVTADTPQPGSRILYGFSVGED